MHMYLGLWSTYVCNADILEQKKVYEGHRNWNQIWHGHYRNLHIQPWPCQSSSWTGKDSTRQMIIHSITRVRTRTIFLWPDDVPNNRIPIEMTFAKITFWVDAEPAIVAQQKYWGFKFKPAWEAWKWCLVWPGSLLWRAAVDLILKMTINFLYISWDGMWWLCEVVNWIITVCELIA